MDAGIFGGLVCSTFRKAMDAEDPPRQAEEEETEEAAASEEDLLPRVRLQGSGEGPVEVLPVGSEAG